MKLREIMELVKDRTLTKDQLEEYRDDLSRVFAEMQLEMADIEKLEAVFPPENFNTAVARKTAWRMTKEGQRLIELKRYSLATKEMLNSLKSRLYNIY